MQLIYGYAETDDDYDDEVDRNHVLHIEEKDYSTSHLHKILSCLIGHVGKYSGLILPLNQQGNGLTKGMIMH